MPVRKQRRSRKGGPPFGSRHDDRTERKRGRSPATVRATGRVAAGRNCYLYVVCGIGVRMALLQRVGILSRIHISEGAPAPHSIAGISAASRHAHFGRARREGPRCRTAKKGDEVAPSHEVASDEVHNLAYHRTARAAV